MQRNRKEEKENGRTLEFCGDLAVFTTRRSRDVSSTDPESSKCQFGIQKTHLECLVKLLSQYTDLIVYLGFSFWRKLVLLMDAECVGGLGWTPENKSKSNGKWIISASWLRRAWMKPRAFPEGIVNPTFNQLAASGAPFAARNEDSPDPLECLSHIALILASNRQWDCLADPTFEKPFPSQAHSLLALACGLDCPTGFAKLLLQRDPTLTKSSTYEWQVPLFRAAAGSSLSLVQFLIRHEEEQSSQTTTEVVCSFQDDHTKSSLLHGAAVNPRSEVLQYLLQIVGCEASRLLWVGATPCLHRAAYQTPDDETASENVKLILAAMKSGDDADRFGLNINSTAGEWDLTTPLHFAAQLNRPLLCKLLLENGANVHAETFSGTPLHGAITVSKSLEIAKMLLDYGASVFPKSDNLKERGNLVEVAKGGVRTSGAMIELLENAMEHESRDASASVNL